MLDIKHTPTATKIIQVDSHEVRNTESDTDDTDIADRCVGSEEAMDATSCSADSSGDERVLDKGKRPLNPYKVHCSAWSLHNAVNIINSLFLFFWV